MADQEENKIVAAGSGGHGQPPPTSKSSRSTTQLLNAIVTRSAMPNVSWLYFVCFFPFDSQNSAKSFKETPYQSLPFFGDQRRPLGLTRMCPTTLLFASTIS
ncbi:hypothetical protein [Pseudoxanthomonas mexicana]